MLHFEHPNISFFSLTIRNRLFEEIDFFSSCFGWSSQGNVRKSFMCLGVKAIVRLWRFNHLFKHVAVILNITVNTYKCLLYELLLSFLMPTVFCIETVEIISLSLSGCFILCYLLLLSPPFSRFTFQTICQSTQPDVTNQLAYVWNQRL